MLPTMNSLLLSLPLQIRCHKLRVEVAAAEDGLVVGEVAVVAQLEPDLLLGVPAAIHHLKVEEKLTAIMQLVLQLMMAVLSPPCLALCLPHLLERDSLSNKAKEKANRCHL